MVIEETAKVAHLVLFQMSLRRMFVIELLEDAHMVHIVRVVGIVPV